MNFHISAILIILSISNNKFLMARDSRRSFSVASSINFPLPDNQIALAFLSRLDDEKSLRNGYKVQARDEFKLKIIA
jgi:hypothetical protein